MAPQFWFLNLELAGSDSVDRRQRMEGRFDEALGEAEAEVDRVGRGVVG
jgi:hypothetical protein